MATVTDGPSAAGPGPAPASAPADVELVQYERYIDRQLQKTRVQVKGVEIAASLITLVVGSLVYLFLVALVDHWVVKGGLGFAGRLLFLLLFLAGAIGYFAVALWPLLVRRINPVYAAQAIERSKPSLKNSLINFLLLRSRPGALPPMVYEAVERQAATGLSQVSVEGAVDRSRLLHVGWALLAIVAVCSLYALVSPKNPLRSFGRVVAPWADIAAPTRVRIADVQPGDGPAFHDQFVTVSAAVSGVTPDEPVTLFYSTADGQVVDQAVAMTLPPGGLRYTAELPPTSGGLQQNVEYHLAAGDAVTRRYKIKVLITPSIVVERVEYEFPRYTEIDPSVAERQGDLKGIEGTRVTIHALANDEIKAAYVDLDCDGRRDLTMQADGRRAKASFALALKPKSDEPEHASYQLRFQNADGEENPRPVRHQIEVIRDLPPEIAFTEPPEAAAKPVRRDEGGINLRAHKNAAGKNATIKNAADKAGPGNNAAKRAVGGPPVDAPQPAEQQLPQGAAMRMAVAASDPDFKLASVKLMAQRNGQALFSNELLPAPAGGPFGGAFLFNTSTLKLAAGDTVTYWAVAEDNKQPDPNRTETPHYTLRITSPEQPQRPQNQVAQNDQKQQQPKPNDKRDPNQRQNQDQRKQGDPQQPSQGQPGEGTPQPGDQSQKDAQRDQQNRDQQRRDQKPQKDEPGEGQAGQGEPGKGQSQKGESSDKNPAEKQQGENNDRGDGKPSQGSQDQGTAGKNQPDKKQPDQSAKPNQSSGADDQRPVDPDAQPGDAIQKIYDRRNQQQQNPADQKDTNDQKQPSEQPTDRSPQDKTNPDQQPGSRGDQSADKKPAGDEKRPDNSAPPSDQSASPQAGGDRSRDKTGQNQKSPGDSPAPQDKSTDRGSDASGQGGKPGENPSAADQPADKSHDGAQSKDGQSGRKAEAGKNDAGKPDSPSAADKQGEKTGADKTAGAKSAADKAANNSEAGKKPDGAKPADGDNAASGDSGKKDAPKPGDGGQSGDPQRSDQEKPPHDGTKPQEKKGGDAEAHNTGEAGAGQPGGNEKGSPSPQGDNAPRDKKQQPSGAGKPDSKDQPESPGISKHQSDTKGGESGDRAGGGSQGGGQRSNSQGTGSAGQNTDSEQGGGKANTPGEGETGDKGGDKTKGKSSDGAGASSGQRGEGNQTQPGGTKPGAGDPMKESQGRKPLDQQGSDAASTKDKPQTPGDQNPAEQRDQKSPDNKQGEPAKQSPDENPSANKQPPKGQSDKGSGKPQSPNQGGNKDPGAATGNPTGGGGMPPDNVVKPQGKAAPNEQGEDDANLEYSRKATDLALAYLKDQLAKEKPDKKLLEELKWSREDAARFVAKWEKMKRDAQTAGPQGDAAKKQLDEALGNLGLRPQGTALRGGDKSETRTPAVRDARRSEPPPEYRQQYRAFTKGAAKSAEAEKPAGNK